MLYCFAHNAFTVTQKQQNFKDTRMTYVAKRIPTEQDCVVVKSKGTGLTSWVQSPPLQLTSHVILGPSTSFPKRTKIQPRTYFQNCCDISTESKALCTVRAQLPLVTTKFYKSLERISNIKGLGRKTSNSRTVLFHSRWKTTAQKKGETRTEKKGKARMTV